MTDLHDELMSGSGAGRTASFKAVGDTWKGEIVAFSKQPDRNPDGTVRRWPSGDPKPDILVVTIQTDERSDEEDDGKRSLWLKYRLHQAVEEAVRKSGAKFAVGGTLAVKFTSENPPKQKGYSAEKVFAAKYEPPAAGVDPDEMF